MLDYVIAGTACVIGIGVVSCVLASRFDERTSTEATGAHRRPRGCPPDPVLRLALETVGTNGLGLEQSCDDDQVTVPNLTLASRRTA